STTVPALEIGGACTGFLAALWSGQRLLTTQASVLIVAIEAPSLWLTTRPGAAGAAAALFGYGAAACLLIGCTAGERPLALQDVCLETAGEAGGLLVVQPAQAGRFEVVMHGRAIAQRAVRGMARILQEICRRNGVELPQLQTIVVHGGNGRMPGLLARQLRLP